MSKRLADEMRSRLDLAPGELADDDELLETFKGSLFEAGCLMTLAGNDFSKELAETFPRLTKAFRGLRG